MPLFQGKANGNYYVRKQTTNSRTNRGSDKGVENGMESAIMYIQFCSCQGASHRCMRHEMSALHSRQLFRLMPNFLFCSIINKAHFWGRCKKINLSPVNSTLIRQCCRSISRLNVIGSEITQGVCYRASLLHCIKNVSFFE